MSAVENGTCEISNGSASDGLSLTQCIHLSFIVLSPLTIVLNMTVIVKINTWKKHKAVARFLFSSLAVVDASVGLLIMPFMIVNEFYDVRNLLGPRTCLLIFSTDVLLSSVSIIHLSLLTYERYITVCKPFEYENYCSWKRMMTVYVTCWIFVGSISFGIIIPEKHLSGIDEQYLRCLVVSSNFCTFSVNAYFAIFSTLATIILPSIVALLFHTKLLLTVRRSSLVRRNYQTNILKTCKTSRNSKSVRVAKTITVLTGCFFVCWLPFFVVNILHAIQRGREPLEFIIVVWLGYINSAVNPFLYLLLQTNSCFGRN